MRVIPVEHDCVCVYRWSLMHKGDQSKTGSAVVRDSFSMHAADYGLIDAIRSRCLKRGVAATKSDILRAALRSLKRMSDSELIDEIKRLPRVKLGRPKKNVE